MEKKFNLKDGEDYIELKNLVKILDYVQSGGEAKMFIQSGEVQVNDEVEIRRGKKLRAGDIVQIDNDLITIFK